MYERLFAVLRDAPNESLPDSEWRALLDDAETHAVRPLVAKRLLPAASGARKEELRAILEASAMKEMLRHRHFAAVVQALAGIPVIALKGMHLASIVYGDVAVRPMRDLDLLVPVDQLTAAGDALQRIGYAPERPYAGNDGYRVWHHLPQFVKQGATTVEIHWHIGHDLAFGVAELWQRSRQARIAGVDVRVLAPEDLLLHLAIHATYGHLCDQSLRAWCDIAATLRHYEISWRDVVERVTRWRCRGGTYLALLASRELAGAPVPEEVLRTLQPDDFDDDLLRIAALDKAAEESRLSPHWMKLRGETTLRGKLRAISRRIFLPRDILADLYAVPRDSPRVFGLYALRLFDLIRHRPAFAAHDRLADRMTMEAFLRHG